MAHSRAKRLKLIAVGLLASMVVGMAVTALLITIFERKQEAKQTFFQVTKLSDKTDDPAEWGKNFPIHYEAYNKTVDQVRTRFGGSEALPRTPSQADPRSLVSQSKLEEDPRLKTLWAGYAFSRDFREERGHAYMLIDQIYTERQQAAQQPGTCLQCHASTYAAMVELGAGDLTKGFDALNKLPYQEAVKLVQHPVSCLDCHDSETIQLRITRPAFAEGISALKASQGVAKYDVNRDASRQEMRSFVCAQCHVEYYFKGEGKRLTFPWSKGIRADEILSYYEEAGHKDWIHKESEAPVLKAQHPEFEMWSQGVHAQAGVACADCHMPYTRVGAMKVTDHHIRSPLLNINRSCLGCHKVAAEEMQNRVALIQGRHFEMRNMALDALIDLIQSIRIAREAKSLSVGALKEVQAYQRKAQFLFDFAEAENSTGFHAPQEAARILMTSLNYTRQGQAIIGRLPLENLPK